MADIPSLETRIEYGETVQRGRADQFLASGLLRPEQIPGDPACPKSRVLRFESDGRQFTVSKGRTSGLVKLCRGMTEEEREDRCARFDAERKYEGVQREERKELEHLPKDREHYARHVRFFVGACFVDSSREFLLKPHGGYSLRAAALDKYVEAVEAAFQDLCVDANIIFSRAARDAFIKESKQRIARADPDFQSFLATSVIAAGGTENG